MKKVICLICLITLFSCSNDQDLILGKWWGSKINYKVTFKADQEGYKYWDIWEGKINIDGTEYGEFSYYFSNMSGSYTLSNDEIYLEPGPSSIEFNYNHNEYSSHDCDYSNWNLNIDGIAYSENGEPINIKGNIYAPSINYKSGETYDIKDMIGFCRESYLIEIKFNSDNTITGCFLSGDLLYDVEGSWSIEDKTLTIKYKYSDLELEEKTLKYKYSIDSNDSLILLEDIPDVDELESSLEFGDTIDSASYEGIYARPEEE